MAKFINLELGRKHHDGLIEPIGKRWINVDCIEQFGGFTDRDDISWIDIDFYDPNLVVKATPQDIIDKIEGKNNAES